MPPVKKYRLIQSVASRATKWYAKREWVKMCRKKRPPGLSQRATLARRRGQFFMCSNISTDTTRSKRPAVMSKSFMSQVTMVRLAKPRRCASASMNAFWVRECDTPVMRECG